MKRKNRRTYSAAGLEHVVTGTNRDVKCMVQTLDYMNTKLSYIIESLRYCVPAGRDHAAPDEATDYR